MLQAPLPPTDSGEALPLLDVRDLTVEFATRRGVVRAVEKINISLAKGETLGIVGESGSGKSVTSYAVMRILDRAGKIAEGSVMFSNLDLRSAPESEMRDLRGREMSMIFQSPRLALNPIRKIGHQIEDVLLQHAQVDNAAVTDKAIEVLDSVRIARPRERYHAYPFELSGGMCQRVVIALALACRPQLLIADEPTTGLDVTTQKAVMDLVVELTRERGMSTILITHDLGLAAAYCDRVVVMQKGHVVETALSETIFKRPAHAYTRKLMRATPRPGITLRDLLPEEAAARAGPVKNIPIAAGAVPLLKVENLVKEYPRKGVTTSIKKMFGTTPVPESDVFRAVDGISFRNRARRKRRPGRRIGLRQVDDVDDGDAADRQDLRHHHLRRRRHRRHRGQELRDAATAQEDPDGVSGSDRQSQSALHRRARHRRSADAAEQNSARRVAGEMRTTGDTSRTCRCSSSTAFRINCPAGRRRASGLRARSRLVPISSSSTSRPPRSTSRSRPLFLTCCRT